MIKINSHFDRKMQEELGDSWSFIRGEVVIALNNIDSIQRNIALRKKIFAPTFNKIILLFIELVRWLVMLPFVRKRHVFLVPQNYWDRESQQYYLFENFINKGSNKSLIIEFPEHENPMRSTGKMKLPTLNAIVLFVLEKLIIRREGKELDISNFSSFGYQVNEKFIEFLNSKIHTAQKRKRISSWVINILSPKSITMVSGYDSTKVCYLMACQELKIRTFEVQHGHIYPGFPGYNFKNISLPEFFPSVLFVWNNYYKEILKSLNVSEERIKICGNPFIKRGKSKRSVSDMHKVLIVNQYTLTDELIKFILKEDINKFSLKIKLHPRFQKEQIQKFSIKGLGDMLLITEERVIDIAPEYDSVVGYYSTALIESLLYNIPTYVIKLIGQSHFSDLISKGYINQIDNLNEIGKNTKGSEFIPPFDEELVNMEFKQ